MIDKDETIKMVDKKNSQKIDDIKSEKKVSGNGKFVKPFVAKKDHVIFQNEVRIDMVKGEKYSEVPVKWQSTLEAEKII